MKKDFSTKLTKAIAAMPPVKTPRPVGRPRKVVEPEQEVQESEEQVNAKPQDEWNNETLSTEEQFRISRCDLPYSTHIAGEFQLRPGANAATIARMIDAALDGRANTTEHLMKLHRHMSQSFSLGGVALAGGALFAELTRILREQGKLPPDTARRYSILEELKAESRLD